MANYSQKIKDAIASALNTGERFFHIPVQKVTVLAYHSISRDGTIVDIAPEKFEAQIAYLLHTFEVVSLDQIVEYVNGKITFQKPVVALTFDDAYADLLANVTPILKKHKIPATVFAIARSQRANRTELDNNKQLMNSSQLKSLLQIGWTIGCHSMTHPYFADLHLDLKTELIDSKKELEKLLGKKVNYFAYPKGIYTSSIVSTIEKAGYRAAFAFEPGIIRQGANRFTIVRMPVDWTHSQAQFEAFFTQWGVAYLTLRHKICKIFNSV
jgi:peptidoglycan/xylan/chitin deacetylase (PgdA/CDA1 family)